MKQASRLPLLLLFMVIAVSIEALLGQKASPAKPNILFIAIDDLNSCLEGMDGEMTIPTPHISRLAKQGILFTNAHCAAPACNPSRVSVMSGLAPSTSGVYLNTQDWRMNEILKDHVTLPHHFRNNGYITKGGGKIYHAASLRARQYTGLLDPRPWDEYFPSKTRQMPLEVRPEKIPMSGNPSYYNGRMDWAALDIETHEMADAKVVNWATEQLSQSHEQPFFLAVGIYRPHIPWWTPKKYFEQHPLNDIALPEVVKDDLDDVPEAGIAMRKQGWHQWMVDNGKWEEAVQGYRASVSFADEMVGRLITALEEGPNAANTIVVLWSDHGYHLGQKEHWEKFALWELTTRVPLIIAAPGDYKAGERSKQPVSLLDIYPTLVELSGTQFAGKLDGVSLVPLLKRPSLPTNRSVVITHGIQNHAIRSDQWRYIQYADGSEELYDQLKDPKNFYNLAGREEYDPVKRGLAVWLPKANAAQDPLENYNQK